MKQRVLIGIGIFACLLAIGFSFHGRQANWFWTNAPFMAILLILLAFGSVRIWHDIGRKQQEQKMRDLLQAMQKNRESGKDAVTRLLTERERNVLDKILEGKNNKQIAGELFVELSTVKTHINNIYKALQVENRKSLLELIKNQDVKTGGENFHP